MNVIVLNKIEHDVIQKPVPTLRHHALVFGGVLAAIPGLLLGGLSIALARLLRTRSPWFYAGAGLVAGTLVAQIDTGRTKSAFAWPEAVPFVIGGCLSALTYWAVVER